LDVEDAVGVADVVVLLETGVDASATSQSVIIALSYDRQGFVVPVVEVAPAPARSQGFGGDAIVRGRCGYQKVIGIV
jgi:hypothetical protein